MDLEILDESTLALIFWATNLQKKVFLAWYQYSKDNSKCNANSLKIETSFSRKRNTKAKDFNEISVSIDKYFYHWRSYALKQRLNKLNIKEKNGIIEREIQIPALRKQPRKPSFLSSETILRKSKGSLALNPNKFKEIKDINLDAQSTELYNTKNLTKNKNGLNLISFNVTDTIYNVPNLPLTLIPPSVFMDNNRSIMEDGINNLKLLKPSDILNVPPKVDEYIHNGKRNDKSINTSKSLNLEENISNDQVISMKKFYDGANLEIEKIKLDKRINFTDKLEPLLKDPKTYECFNNDTSVKRQLVQELLEMRNNLNIYIRDNYAF